MEVTVAKHAGFCFGVERAVDTAMQEASKKEGRVYTYGPVVHNETVIHDLSELGVEVVDEESIKTKEKGTVIIRAHGVTRKTEEMIRKYAVNVIDATCPFVKKIHRIVEKSSAEGMHILIAGDPLHPEVQGIVGWCSGPVTVIQTEEEAMSFRPLSGAPVCMVAQTTFNLKKFEKMIEIINDSVYNVNIANTICNATKERQEEAGALAAVSDMMIVIGSESSSNSRKLYEICKGKCSHTCFIQSKADLNDEWFQDVVNVGITAGASTPKKILKEVQTHVRKF